ncbi:MAG TPA: nucleoside 2-deoxyribosyltransferase [Methanotrichaceae archaeon]|nr:nucleoside 2-deoxyribosyltransferase [Methanotrichaceae archaeon]
MRCKIYLAGPLFSSAEIEWAGMVKKEIEKALGDRAEVIWPHEIASGSAREIFEANTSALRGCDLLVAILDGAQVDDGTAWEVGFHYGRHGRILGIRTDFRQAGETSSSKVNAMIECACIDIAQNLDELIFKLEELL